eukprot:5024277-Pleurochrysis_carterae.AAC.1
MAILLLALESSSPSHGGAHIDRVTFGDQETCTDHATCFSFLCLHRHITDNLSRFHSSSERLRLNVFDAYCACMSDCSRRANLGRSLAASACSCLQRSARACFSAWCRPTAAAACASRGRLLLHGAAFWTKDQARQYECSRWARATGAGCAHTAQQAV